jgi:3-deoxy-D-manno-octulosonic-acid transferase
MRLIYNLLLMALLPFLPLRLWLRGRREPGYRQDIGQRFGFYGRRPQPAASPGQPLLWIHAVSLGETRAAEPMIRALVRMRPGCRLLITQMTATGRAAARERFPEATLAYLPYDYPFAVRRFLAHFQPEVGVLMETELWPNLLAACAARRLPVVLANARLSERSARGYRRAGALARETFAALRAVAAQSGADAERLRSLGATNISVTGNIKFDMSAPEGTGALAAGLRASFGARFVWLLASTREGEEDLILEALSGRSLPPDLLIVIVPRHPQRFEAVARLLGRDRARLPRRSRADAAGPGDRFYLGDSLGELAAFYRACDLTFVGGSLLPLGGQNLIEACAAGAPVLIGPSTFNFADASAQALAAGAALQVADAKALVNEALRLRGDAPRRAAMGEAGRRFAATHQGAAERVARLILEQLPPQP